MHPQELLDMVATFEDDLAAFYEKQEKVDRFSELKDILQFMHKHSAIHAQLVRNYRSEARIPKFNPQPLQQLHAKIIDALSQQLEEIKDLNEVGNKLAQAEELVGVVYRSIADHYNKLSDIYQKLGHKFNALADDELDHRDQIHHKMSPSQHEPVLSKDDPGSEK